jgi:hypothetical protein
MFLFGCAISVKDGDDIQFQNYKVISQFNAKLLPREQRLARITNDMKKVGFKRPKVSQVFDTFSDSVLSIFKHQKNIMNEHKTLLDNHRDVLSFLMANKDKNKTQLHKAISDFDKTAKNEQEKIAPKIQAYEKASDKIWQENLKLSLLITEQTLKLAHVIYQQGDDLAGIQGIQMLFNASKINDAYNLAEIRLHLAKVANEFIDDEKAIIDISKQLQTLQDAD